MVFFPNVSTTNALGHLHRYPLFGSIPTRRSVPSGADCEFHITCTYPYLMVNMVNGDIYMVIAALRFVLSNNPLRSKTNQL